MKKIFYVLIINHVFMRKYIHVVHLDKQMYLSKLKIKNFILNFLENLNLKYSSFN